MEYYVDFSNVKLYLHTWRVNLTWQWYIILFRYSKFLLYVLWCPRQIVVSRADGLSLEVFPFSIYWKNLYKIGIISSLNVWKNSLVRLYIFLVERLLITDSVSINKGNSLDFSLYFVSLIFWGICPYSNFVFHYKLFIMSLHLFNVCNVFNNILVFIPFPFHSFFLFYWCLTGGYIKLFKELAFLFFFSFVFYFTYF